MSEATVMQVFSQALMTAFRLSAPILIISLVVGLVIAILQAATQVHEQTLTFVPKLIAIALILMITGSWMISTMNEFTRLLFETIAMYA